MQPKLIELDGYGSQILFVSRVTTGCFETVELFSNISVTFLREAQKFYIE